MWLFKKNFPYLSQTFTLKLCLLSLVILLTVEQLQGQYYRSNQQQNFDPSYGQDGRTYYQVYTEPPAFRSYNGQGYDSFGRPLYNNPQGFPYVPIQAPMYPVRSRGSCSPPSNALQTVTVRTKLGEVVGKIEYLCDHPDSLHRERRPTNYGSQTEVFGNVSVFLGIPYSEAPIRDRRFRPPVSTNRWHRLEAFSYRPACPQPPGLKDNAGNPVPIDEDCLYLNIFTPSISQYGEKFPVMIYIHGGEFESGTAAYFPGHMLAAAMRVVVVTFNYRLGSLGFFSTGDGESPGNYGILDQSLAIRWVYNNIDVFSGNPLKITLFGPDAGAASAGLHMLSPQTRDLFQAVIAQGGAAVADWGIITDLERARNTSRVFAEYVGCDATSTSRLVSCLRNRSPRELTEFNVKPQLGMFAWAPVVDKNISMPEQHRFMPDTPEEIIKRGQFDTSKLYVTGVTRDEGAHILLKDIGLSVVNYQINHVYFRQKILEYLKMYNYTLNANGALNAILYQYTNWADVKNESLIRESYVNMLSDAVYKAPVDKMVKLLAEKGLKVYMYLLNTTVESLQLPSWLAIKHNLEWYFLTGAPFLEDKYFPKIESRNFPYSWTDNDRRMSELMMRMWANIATYRNPTFENAPYITWQPVQPHYYNYLCINGTLYSSMLRDYRQTECAFWTIYMPTLLGPPPPTYPPYLIPWWQYEQPLQVGFWSAVTVCFILLVMFIIVCCMYCRIAGHEKVVHVEFNGSLPPDDYSLTHPLKSETETETTKPDPKTETQHTSV